MSGCIGAFINICRGGKSGRGQERKVRDCLGDSLGGFPTSGQVKSLYFCLLFGFTSLKLYRYLGQGDCSVGKVLATQTRGS